MMLPFNKFRRLQVQVSLSRWSAEDVNLDNTTSHMPSRCNEKLLSKCALERKHKFTCFNENELKYASLFPPGMNFPLLFFDVVVNGGRVPFLLAEGNDTMVLWRGWLVYEEECVNMHDRATIGVAVEWV